MSIEELARAVEVRLRALECARDVRTGFLAERLRQLGRVRAAMDARDFGATTGWIERLELEHVQAYLRSDDAWDRRDLAGTPAPWQEIFRAGGQRRAERIAQAAALVHLTYDLPLALARVGFGVSFGKTALAYDHLAALYAESRSLAAQIQSSAAGQAHWQRVLREQAWDDARALGTRDDRERQVTFTRIEVAALCEVRRVFRVE